MPKTEQKTRNSKSMQIVMIGNGSWGKALTKTLRSKAFDVTLLGRESLYKKEIFDSVDYVVLAAPFKEVEKILRRLAKIDLSLPLVNASKGIDRLHLKTFSPIASSLGFKKTASLSGPTFAKELSQKKPTACVAASHSKAFSQAVSEDFSTSFFRVYQHLDPVGVEVCGALKNILAIAAGMADGSRLGFNARAALLTRGLQEMMLLVDHLGGQATSVFGLAGSGDLWLTATGPLSRNRQFGMELAKGLKKDRAKKNIGQVVEGLYTVKQIEKIRKQEKLNLPICHEVYKVACLGRSVEKSLETLMSRALKIEESSQWKLLQRESSKHLTRA